MNVKLKIISNLLIMFDISAIIFNLNYGIFLLISKSSIIITANCYRLIFPLFCEPINFIQVIYSSTGEG